MTYVGRVRGGTTWWPCERIDGGGKRRPSYRPLCRLPMRSGDVLPWLIEHGFVVDRGDIHVGGETFRDLDGWGSRYFAVHGPRVLRGVVAAHLPRRV